MMLKLKYMVVVPVGDTKNGADCVCIYIIVDIYRCLLTSYAYVE